ncbi:MAG: 23S rRNA (guanosine(2251)-2'-O)-methyltransferase RlmB [Cyclobacteriaceae bacterium]|nr:23S rRNA (guanosine(2251)-2'-O)-methyltransferase RlmB [Cyclobacteriaceae bacterium]
MNKDIIFGIQPVIEAILSGKEIDKLIIQKNAGIDSTRELFSHIKTHKIPFQKVPVEKLNKITRKNHQGVIAFVSSVDFASLDSIVNEAFSKGKDPLILILDRVTDIRNFGAIVRTAECTGVDAIVIPARGSAALNADAMKTSAGALNYVPVCRSPYLIDDINYLKNSGLTLIGMTEKTDKGLYDLQISGPVALIMGSEEDGISPEYLKACDYLAKIPILGEIGSLNVSVAAGVALYEITRQRLKTD